MWETPPHEQQKIRNRLMDLALQCPEEDCIIGLVVSDLAAQQTQLGALKILSATEHGAVYL